MSSQIHTPEVVKFIKEVSEEMIFKYGQALINRPNLHVNSVTMCDIHISIVSTFTMNILNMVQEVYKCKLGDAVNPQFMFNSMVEEITKRFKFN